MKSPFFHFIIAVAVGVGVLSGYGVWYAVIEAKSAAVASLQNEIDTKTETMSRANSARAAIAETASDETAVQNYFVPKTGVVAFINNLEARGETQGATLGVLSVSAGVGTRPTLVLSVTVKGTFDAVMRTVGTIEYAPYDISISTLSLEQDARNSWHADIGLIVGSVDSATRTATTTATNVP